MIQLVRRVIILYLAVTNIMIQLESHCIVAVTNIIIQLERRSLYCILQFTNIMIQLTYKLEFLSLEAK